ncbi:MAG TPA: GSCFA domain-containing protein [Gaiellaceae bacterium]|jgi:hypothetical protein
MAKYGTIGNLQKGRSGSWQKRHWHAVGATRFPLEASAFEADLPGLIREHVLPGHTPPEPMLQQHDSVITLGSCFARELRLFLAGAGFASDNFWIPSALNNTYAVLDFVSWCVSGAETGRGYRYDRQEDGDIADWKPAEEREQILGRLRDAGAYVFTLGLAEIWEDRETGQVFWRGIPRERFDPDRHVFRVSTVEENERNLHRIVELIREVSPQAPIVFTLSPVPLMATFRGISAVTADCVSKSILRVALDRVLAQEPEHVYYWPSFEIVRWLGGHLPSAVYGGDDGVSRHVTRSIVAHIVEAFVEAFYTPEARAAFAGSASSPSAAAGADENSVAVAPSQQPGLAGLAVFPEGGRWRKWDEMAVELEAAEFLYATVRALKPETVVESGSGKGYGSAFIAQALADNRHGHLTTYEPEPKFAAVAEERLAGLPATVVNEPMPIPYPSCPDFVFIDSGTPYRRAEIGYWLDQDTFLAVHDAGRYDLPGGLHVPTPRGLWVRG